MTIFCDLLYIDQLEKQIKVKLTQIEAQQTKKWFLCAS